MAAVGCTKEGENAEGFKPPQREEDQPRPLRRNGSHPASPVNESASETSESRPLKAEKGQRVNGTLKGSISVFTKPTFIPISRLQKDKKIRERNIQRIRSSKGKFSLHQLRLVTIGVLYCLLAFH